MGFARKTIEGILMFKSEGSIIQRICYGYTLDFDKDVDPDCFRKVMFYMGCLAIRFYSFGNRINSLALDSTTAMIFDEVRDGSSI